MPHKLRKIRKKRGSRTQGYGRVGQHRKSGSKGKRKAGRHKHLWSYVVSCEPSYYDKVRFVSPKGQYTEEKVMNVGELEELAQKLVHQEKIRGKITIDLNRLGYTKLLGKGKLTRPIEVRVASCSEIATKKIEAVGGKALIDK